MKYIPTHVYTAQQVRDLDRVAIDELGIPGFTLMTRAGEAALDCLRELWPGARRILVLCGAGNNAGDGYVLATHAQRDAAAVTVVAVSDPERLKGDAAHAWSEFRTAGGHTSEWDPTLLEHADVVIDALLGTGLDRPLDGRYLELVDAVNGSGTPVLSLDLPTGLDADRGAVLGAAVVADATMTFVGLKTGFFLGRGPDHIGRLFFSDLRIPGEVYAGRDYPLARLDTNVLERAFPVRRRTAHKGDHGRLLLVGGGAGMPGAIRLAAEAALRTGAGLVTAVTRPEHVAAVVTARPEIMCRGIEDPAELVNLLDAADVVAVGPGIGRDAWADGLMKMCTASELPLVVDADGLNWLAENPLTRGNWVLTPHPGEAARLLGESTGAVQADRLGSLEKLVNKYSATVVLKGACTLIGSSGDRPTVCDHGNPGMASPGMGDVLTGVIAGAAAQCRDLKLAARAGVLAHAVAGDAAAEAGERGLVASDLFSHLRDQVNQPWPV